MTSCPNCLHLQECGHRVIEFATFGVRCWFGGHSRVGEDVVIDYRLAYMAVREMYALEDGPVPVLLRTLELGP